VDVVDLHRYLALVSATAVALVGLEGLVRAGNNRPPGALAGWGSAIATLALALTIAGGFGLFMRGARPREILHFIYAGLAITTIPLINTFTGKLSPRARGLAAMFGAIIVLVIMWRLSSTG
jgi:hypothetical protein